MGFTAVRYGDEMSGIFLKDGARLTGSRSEVIGEMARQTVQSTAAKVLSTVSKKFSLSTVIIAGRQISAWDFYCQCLFRNAGVYRDRPISEFMRMTINRWINGMSDEMRWVIEMHACNTAHVEDDVTLSREIIAAIIQAEVVSLARDHGEALLSKGMAANG